MATKFARYVVHYFWALKKWKRRAMVKTLELIALFVQYPTFTEPGENMCGNIRPLFNFDPPSTEEEVYASALQFVRKISGYQNPSVANTEAFETAVLEIAAVSQTLLDNLTTKSKPKNREVEIAKRRARNKKRFAKD